MTHEHADDDSAVMFSQKFWDERYGATDRVWSGNPNPVLVSEVAPLTPGSAFEVGSGEGADAIWLAGQGWRVTALDVSIVALERSALRAADAGAEIAASITWQQADLASWVPGPERFDLVTAHFVYLSAGQIPDLHRRLASAVAPGGSLLVVGHHPRDLETTVPRWGGTEMLFTAEQVAAVLDPQGWRIITSEARPRQGVDPDGAPVTLHDTVLHAVRS